MTVAQDIDDGLTEEERLALVEEDDGDAIALADDGAGDVIDDKDVEAKAEADAAADPEPAAVAEPVAAAEPVEAKSQQAPILVAPAPEDAEARLNDIETQKESLLTQFDDGDITMREYQKQVAELDKTVRAIERSQDRAELAAQMDQQRLQNDWVSTCNAFVENNSIYKDNPRLYKALDAEVRELAADPKTANWTGQKFLDEAHGNLKKAFGLAESPADKATAKQRRELPPNLAKVPASEVQDTNGGRFAVLDRMATSDPVGYEDTLAKMPAAERDAYLAAG